MLFSELSEIFSGTIFIHIEVKSFYLGKIVRNIINNSLGP